ncbi:PREDICTED: uncharacterized protein At5g39865 [Ipomoea nil]|uniref:uncharacterized protein At5g39865 n=1 Tax=Ipomoea nil TaxID=35883 RepID=UPI00090153D2|nr:PREDICTED: uncharacterized protein At5g39865 [Ipomoea nil]
MASLKQQSFLPPLNLPTLHESFDNNILSVPEITKDVFQEEALEEFQELATSRKTKPALCEETQKEDEESPTLPEFEEKCPPGGRESVVLYTTSLRGINKTFEDCKRIRFLLDSFKVVYQERDVSMHLEYREELWETLGGGGRVIPPRLFIKGRLIGGADEVVGLHERGALRTLLKGIPLVPSVSPCKGCSGMRFVLCLKCHGSCKITAEEDKMDDLPVRCPDCNENGLIKCPLCN